MIRMHARILIASLICAALGAGSAGAAGLAPLKSRDLDVTTGTVTQRGASMRTDSAAMRAVHRDGGDHADTVRLTFRDRGPIANPRPLGSGIVFRQIGLKLRAQDPCNLVYVMWRAEPRRELEVSVKRNPGKRTSKQCGNSGYRKLAAIPVAAGDHHTFRARSQRTGDGGLRLTLSADGAQVYDEQLPAALTANLDGPAGLRSDNGVYSFRLAAV